MSFRKRLQSQFAIAKKKYLKEHPNCEVCLLFGKLIPASDVHHVIGRYNTDLYLDETNFISLCRFHHNDVMNKDGKTKQLIEKIVKRREGL